MHESTWPCSSIRRDFPLQGELLAAVNDSLEALGLPRGTSQAPLSKGQRWLASHGLSTDMSSTIIKSAQPHGAKCPHPTALQDGAASQPSTLNAEASSGMLSAWDPESAEPASSALDSFVAVEQRGTLSSTGLDLVMAETVKPRSVHNSIRRGEQASYGDPNAESYAMASALMARSDAVSPRKAAAELQLSEEQLFADASSLHLQSNTAQQHRPVISEDRGAAQDSMPAPQMPDSTSLPSRTESGIAAEGSSRELQDLSPSSSVPSPQEASSLLAMADSAASGPVPRSPGAVPGDGLQLCSSEHEPAAVDYSGISVASNGSDHVQPFTVSAGVMSSAFAVPPQTDSVDQLPDDPQAVDNSQQEGSDEEAAFASRDGLAAPHWEEGYANLQSNAPHPEELLASGLHSGVAVSNSQAEAMPIDIHAKLPDSAAGLDAEQGSAAAVADAEVSTHKGSTINMAAGFSAAGAADASGTQAPALHKPEQTGVNGDASASDTCTAAAAAAAATAAAATAAAATQVLQTSCVPEDVLCLAEVTEEAPPCVALPVAGQKGDPEDALPSLGQQGQDELASFSGELSATAVLLAWLPSAMVSLIRQMLAQCLRLAACYASPSAC